MNSKVDTLFQLIAAHNNLSPSSAKVFKELMKFLDADGLININFYHKKHIANEAGVAPHTVNNVILKLKKTGFLKSIDTGCFKPNKSLFVDEYFDGLYARTGWKNLNYEIKINSNTGLMQVVGLKNKESGGAA
ncbi:hypothetical protein [Pseudomonas syringae]|uniref:hypothetical protein n=1 Tax=Pseudomonas syringae TaxID=317 RepID=UPI00128EC077|nr:hypothetical protein [Pseudomonas syringae]